MLQNDLPDSLLASVLALPPSGQLAIMDAIHDSLADPSVDHRPEENREDVQSLWRDEIQRRIEDVNTGKVTTISAETAESMIRSDA